MDRERATAFWLAMRESMLANRPDDYRTHCLAYSDWLADQDAPEDLEQVRQRRRSIDDLRRDGESGLSVSMAASGAQPLAAEWLTAMLHSTNHPATFLLDDLPDPEDPDESLVIVPEPAESVWWGADSEWAVSVKRVTLVDTWIAGCRAYERMLPATVDLQLTTSYSEPVGYLLKRRSDDPPPLGPDDPLSCLFEGSPTPYFASRQRHVMSTIPVDEVLIEPRKGLRKWVRLRDGELLH